MTERETVESDVAILRAALRDIHTFARTIKHWNFPARARTIKHKAEMALLATNKLGRDEEQ